MLDNYLRPKLEQWLVTPAAKLCQSLPKLTANHITLVSLITGALAAALVAMGSLVVALIFLALSGYCDMLDGAVARLREPSVVGGLFDIMADRAVEFLLVFGLFCFDPASRGTACMLMMGSILLCVTSFLLVGIFTQQASEKSFYYSEGLMERAEAFIFFAAMIIWPSYFTLLALVFVVLVLYTALLRCWQFIRQHNA